MFMRPLVVLMISAILLTAFIVRMPSAPSVHAATGTDSRKVLEKYQPNIDKGLQWLAKKQSRDGHWDAQGGQYPVPMTALAGMALLGEGSTAHNGKYAKEIDLAVEYLLGRAQRNGLIGDPRDPHEQQRYMYGHGFSLMFLSQVYGEEMDDKRRKELEKVLTRAADFTSKAQTKYGGWGYVSSADNPDFDEGSVTITQVQALRAARDAGISVAKETIDKAHDYLKKSTVVASKDANPLKEEAGVIYSLRQGANNIRPPLTAAGIACLFNAGEYKSDLAVKWLNYCQRYIPVDKSGRDSFGHWEYTHYYYAQVMYALGEDRHGQMRPDLAEAERKNPEKKNLLKWSRYREVIFDYICSRQGQDGSWNQGYIGPVYTTSMYLTILQLDKAALPIYQR